MKTRAAVLHQTGLAVPYAASRPLVVEELDLDPPGRDEVLVRLRAAGLCHSDLSVINGDRPRPTPMALGHEAAGEVLECGAGVADLAPGDRVVLVFVPSCGGCVRCLEGRPALCEPAAAANAAGTLLCGERRLHLGGREVHHHLGVSAFSEYAVVSRRSLIRFDPSLSYEEAALFGCAVLTGVGAVVNTARVPAGSTVAVVGLGGVGLNALLGGLLVGAREVVAVDLSAAKLLLARELGATATFDAGDPAALAHLREHTGGGVDYAFEMAGSVAAMDFAYRATRRGGTTVTAGLSHPAQTWAVQHVSLVAEERTVQGSYIGSAVPLRDIPRYMALYRQGRLPVDRLMSGRLPLDEVNAGFDRLAAGGAVRQLLTL